MSKIIVNTEVMGPDFSELVLHELNYEWSREVVTLAASEADLPFGMVLICGPTGSGKSTTLYATLRRLNKTSDNILTIEDPIEYTLEGVNQVQLKEEIGLTFTSALRTCCSRRSIPIRHGAPWRVWPIWTCIPIWSPIRW